MLVNKIKKLSILLKVQVVVLSGRCLPMRERAPVTVGARACLHKLGAQTRFAQSSPGNRLQQEDVFIEQQTARDMAHNSVAFIN